MPFAQRQRLTSGWERPSAAALGLGLLLGFLGPFGSYPAYSPATRYLFWLGLTAAGMLLALAADRMLPATRPLPTPARVGAIALASALPMTFVVAWAIAQLQPGRTFAPRQLVALFIAVSATQLLVAIAARLAARPAPPPVGVSTAPGAAEAPPTYPTSLLGKLPRGVGDKIVALETEDHYLRVHYREGSALVLMRMSDAAATIDPRLGLQVHRRWWVAADAVTELSSEGHQLCLSTSNGLRIPVGKTFASAARARFATTA